MCLRQVARYGCAGGGIATGLSLCAEWGAFVACDMPLVNLGLFRHLAQLASEESKTNRANKLAEQPKRQIAELQAHITRDDEKNRPEEPHWFHNRYAWLLRALHRAHRGRRGEGAGRRRGRSW